MATKKELNAKIKRKRAARTKLLAEIHEIEAQKAKVPKPKGKAKK